MNRDEAAKIAWAIATWYTDRSMVCVVGGEIKDTETALADAITEVLLSAVAGEREACVKAAFNCGVSMREAGDKARAAGREGVASHRGSDAEASDQIAAAIRARGDG